MNNNIIVGIIGGTRGMGRWFADLMRKENYTVHVCGRKTPLGMDEMAKLCHVVVVAVPISVTAEAIKYIGPLLTSDQLLMDLTSLKKEPVKLMLKSSAAEVIGCHPLFGPNPDELAEQNVILCPARTTKWLPWIKSILEKNKLVVSETTPDRHDKMMAVVQVLNHLNTISLGMALTAKGISLAELDKFSTPILRTKIDIMKKVFTENPELYADIITRNPDTLKILDIYKNALTDIRQIIKSGSGEKLKKALERAAKKLF
jgi:prephenate dehydrogenase